MPTATTAEEDSSSKMVQNYPHDFTKRHNYVSALLPTLYRDKNAEAIDRIGYFLKNELVAAIPPAASSRAY
jgi:hypothetical protein